MWCDAVISELASTLDKGSNKEEHNDGLGNLP